MTIQLRFSKSPKYRPMVGKAVAMMVWFSAARNAASIRPKKIFLTSAWLIGVRETCVVAAGLTAIRAPSPRRPRTLSRTRARARAATREKFMP